MRPPEDVAVTHAVRVSSYATADAKGIDPRGVCLVARALWETPPRRVKTLLGETRDVNDDAMRPGDANAPNSGTDTTS